MATTTNRILEFTPSQEEAVVSRVLVLVHQAVDESFPGVEKAGRQFTKTVFSAEGESTALSPTPSGTFGSDEATSPGGRPGIDTNPSHGVPLPPNPAPARQAGPTAPAKQLEREPSPPHSGRPAPIDGAAVAARSGHGAFISAEAPEDVASLLDDGSLRADWPMRIMLALFIAGGIVLAYALLV
jgi:hypothetical protein